MQLSLFRFFKKASRSKVHTSELTSGLKQSDNSNSISIYLKVNSMNKATLQQIFGTNAGFGALALRVPVGIIFAAHGAQKLFGWFGGYGLEGTAGWLESIGIAPGILMAFLVGAAEFFGGLALVFGVLTRPAAATLVIAMVVAIFKVHFANGFFMSTNGYEFALALLAASVSLLLSGAGKASIDAIIAKKLS
jgi:putative oxidoreductase